MYVIFCTFDLVASVEGSKALDSFGTLSSESVTSQALSDYAPMLLNSYITIPETFRAQEAALSFFAPGV